MKRHIILILLVFTLASVTVSCGQRIIPSSVATKSVIQSDSTRMTSHPDAKLNEFKQIKMNGLNQLSANLAELQTEIKDKESEFERENQIIKAEEERLIKQYGALPPSLNAYSIEYISLHLTGGAGKQLQQLHEQEKPLLATKQYLEKDIKEIEQYYQLDIYYEFKLSQLNDVTSQLIVLRIDIDQKTFLKESQYQLQQRYDELLSQRQFLQQDIEQLKKLIQAH